MWGFVRILSACLALCACPVLARAQWIVVTSGTSSDPALTSAGVRAAAGVREAGKEVMEASDRTVSDLTRSQPFAPVTEEELAQLSRASEEALEHVALGRDERALQIADETLARFENRLAAIGRTSQGAQHIQDLCLYGVRAEMHQQRSDESLERVKTCLRFVPDLVPNPNLHPPTVRRLVAEARELLEGNRGGTLIVRASSDDPGECPVRINGRRMGQTPLLRLSMFAGPVRVQVECDPQRPGAVHTTTIAPQGETTLSVHVLLESALVRENGQLAFRYTTGEQQGERQFRHAATMSRTPPGHDVLLVWAPSPDVFRLDYFARNRDGDMPTASARVRADNAESITSAANAIASGEVPPAEENPASAADGSSEGAFVVDDLRETDSGGVSPGIAGWALAGVGVAGLTTAWVLFVDWQRIDDRVGSVMEGDPIDLENLRDQRDDRELQTLVAGGIGAGALTLALPFWLPREEGIPAWAWITGAAGVGLATVGAIVWAQHDSGSDGEDETLRVPLAPLLVMHAAPLLGVPITYAIRSAFSDDASVSASVTLDDQSFTLRVRGAF